MIAVERDIAVVLGTRPEIIKLAPVIRSLGDRARVIHTGQHYDPGMADRFFKDLGIGSPHVVLTGVAGQGRAEQIAAGLAGLSRHFRKDPPAVVIVQGDTNSTSIGAQAGNYAGIPVLHVEAGLRSYDRAMPEEINRLVVCALAEVHCAATHENVRNLVNEGIDPAKIYRTGNTVVEASRGALKGASAAALIPAEVAAGGYLLATIHRQENTDDPIALIRILDALDAAPLRTVFVVHPRTAAALERAGLTSRLLNYLALTDIGHPEFLALMAGSRLVVSDSGGVQEEVTVLGKRMLVVRRSTERPESIRTGFARLVTPAADLHAAILEELSDRDDAVDLSGVPSPYGDGRAGREIARIARELSTTREWV